MQGMTFPILVYQTTPNKKRLDIEVMGKKIVMAYDGAIGWPLAFSKAFDSLSPTTSGETFRSTCN